MKTYRSTRRTTLDRLRRSRILAHTALFASLLSTVGSSIPRSALAQTATPIVATNPGNPGASPGPANAGLQEGETDLGTPETGPAAAAGSLASGSVDPSTGAFTASIPFVLPQARGAVQPSLALTYSSSGVTGVGGVGWSLNRPSNGTTSREHRSTGTTPMPAPRSSPSTHSPAPRFRIASLSVARPSCPSVT